MKNKLFKTFISIFFLILIYALLLIPEPETEIIQAGDKSPFVWNSDQFWSELEKRFTDTRHFGCDSISSTIEYKLTEFDSLVKILQNENVPPERTIYNSIEQKIFDLSVMLGACPDSLSNFINAFSYLRTALKNQSISWNMDNQLSRDRVYRILYGGRTAIEEIILQSPRIELPNIFVETNEPTSTPSAEILGLEIHSGDILVSRGGAPTSALIARGNDYPGNFSHIALVYVDEISNDVSIIESHIEIGVAIADIDQYFKDKKLRVMVLRPRYDLPSLDSDPMLPHKAAKYALNRALTEKIPYDFAMDTDDFKKLFCSEVAYEAYSHYGLKLWSTLSHISSAGVRNWLSEFGVKNFTTMEPSDLEYDPQLRVVAEWRDYETLYKDHMDNAIVDIMLESAESKERIGYDWYLLPFARLLKGYSFILNLFDKVGPIPEGMSATGALKNKWFSNRHMTAIEKLKIEANQFYTQKGYVPPYWELIKLARKVYMQ